MRRKGNYNRGRQNRRRGPGIWTGNFLKMIAIAAMLMDHVAVVILEQGIIAVCQGDAAISLHLCCFHKQLYNLYL